MSIRKMTIPCSVNGAVTPVDFFVGEPMDENTALKFQQTWLSSAKGGSIPEAVLSSLENLRKISKEKNLNFADLCYSAMELANLKKKNQAANNKEAGADQLQMQKTAEQAIAHSANVQAQTTSNTATREETASAKSSEEKSSSAQ